MTELWEVVSTIPEGVVVSYGAIGRALSNPVSGLLVGRWMFQTPPGSGIPWWRVVGSKGDLLIARRDVRLADEQRQKLEAEGVEFDDDRVKPEFFFELL